MLEARLEILQQELVKVSRYCHSRGWSLATSGNFSAKLGENRIFITASGQDKGALTTAGLVEVTLEGTTSGALTPSAETQLHCALYRHDPAIGAVFHTHSPYATSLSREFASRGFLELAGYEMLKALRGVRTHEHREFIPILPNHQDMAVLSQGLLPYIRAHEVCHAFLIESHGLYTWGRDIPEALRHLEALEFLMQCECIASGRRQP